MMVMLNLSVLIPAGSSEIFSQFKIGEDQVIFFSREAIEMGDVGVQIGFKGKSV
jgi:hypothetical protein